MNIMLYIPNIDDYLQIKTDEEMKDFVAINILNLQHKIIF